MPVCAFAYLLFFLFLQVRSMVDNLFAPLVMARLSYGAFLFSPDAHNFLFGALRLHPLHVDFALLFASTIRFGPSLSKLVASVKGG
ncbi:hypothetical protein MANES_17G038972v8 [Manihot esculenta]|uniref:Uncharacterized protein n=1 Tax=Manihot esculenta TaxID=3983 RepID=A0ACB7G279_MANES|nr:hypothetical protein MANES_17G038972v8 [Manihot esculenta]